MTDPQISSVNETNILTPLRSALESNNLEDWTVLRDIFQQLPQNSFNSPLSQSLSSSLHQALRISQQSPSLQQLGIPSLISTLFTTLNSSLPPVRGAHTSNPPQKPPSPGSSDRNADGTYSHPALYTSHNHSQQYSKPTDSPRTSASSQQKPFIPAQKNPHTSKKRQSPFQVAEIASQPKAEKPSLDPTKPVSKSPQTISRHPKEARKPLRTQPQGANASILSDETKKLLSFDEDELNEYAVPVPTWITEKPVVGKWKAAEGNGVVHFNGNEKRPPRGIRRIDEEGHVSGPRPRHRRSPGRRPPPEETTKEPSTERVRGREVVNKATVSIKQLGMIDTTSPMATLKATHQPVSRQFNSEKITPDFQAAKELKTIEDVITYFAGCGKADPVKFVYMNVNPRQKALKGQNEYDPYDLIVVPKDKIDPEHYIVSVSGLVHVIPPTSVLKEAELKEKMKEERVINSTRNNSLTSPRKRPVQVQEIQEDTPITGIPQPVERDDFETTTLSNFMRDMMLYRSIRTIPFFNKFPMVKYYYLWKREVRYRLYCNHSRTIVKELFYAHPSFCTVLTKLGSLYFDTSLTQTLFGLEQNRKQPYEIEEFKQLQTTLLVNTKSALQVTSSGMEQLVAQLVTDVLQRAHAPNRKGGSTDATNAALMSIMKNAQVTKSMAQEKKEQRDRRDAVKMALFEEEMISRFLTLLDYICVESLFQMMKNSIKQTLVQMRSFLKTKGSLFLIAFHFTPKDGVDFTTTFSDEEEVEEVAEVKVEDQPAEEDGDTEEESEEDISEDDRLSDQSEEENNVDLDELDSVRPNEDEVTTNPDDMDNDISPGRRNSQVKRRNSKSDSGSVKSRESKRKRRKQTSTTPDNFGTSAMNATAFKIDSSDNANPLENVDLVLSPTRSEVLHIFQNSISSALQILTGVDRPLKIPPHRNLLGKNPPGGLKLEDVIQGDDETQTMIREMVFLIEQSFTSAETYLTRFYALSKISEFSLRWDFEQYKRNIRSVSRMRNDLRRLSQWSQDIVKINLSSLVGLITLDARPLKQNLAPIPVECADQIKSHLHDLFNSIGNETLRDLRQCTNELNNAPKNLSEYCDHVLLIGTMRERQVGFRQNVATLDDMKALGDEQASQLSMDEQQLLLSIHSSLGAFNTSLVKSEEFRDQHHMRMVAGLHKEAQKLETDTLQTSNDLQTGILVDETADPQSALQRLEVIKSTVDSYTERMAVLDKQREIIGMDAIAYPNVQRCVVKYQNRVNVWTQLKEFNSAASLWRSSILTELDPEPIAQQVQVSLRATGLAEKEEPDDRVVKLLRQNIDDFRPYVPLLNALCVPAMKPRHWKKLFTALGKQWTATLTLGQIMTMNLLQYAPQVMDISATANGEYGLETQLEKIMKIWAQMQFVLVRHKSGTTHILGGVEEIVETLEDNQALLQTMLASRFVVGIREEIEGWDRRMTQLQDLIDKWVKCQRGWMYLYAIFTQPDIIRQLSNEAAQFNSVDSSWKEVMKLVHENPNCIRCLDIPNIVEQMEKNNEQLDLLQKKLQDYLETKRVKFPRFYFLSNDELLQILAQTTDARAVQPFMNKCFDAINSLQFCSEKDMKEKKTDVDEMTPEEKKAFSKLNPNSADFVTAMVSVENEVVPLLKPVSTHSPVEEWLLEFEHEMCRTINVAIRNALTHYFQTDRPNWFFHHPAQAILAVDQIVWTQNVEEALTKVESGEDKNAIDAYSGKVKDQLAEAVNLVRGSLAPLERATINTVIVIDVHARDIVNQLLQKGITSKEDFDWMVNLRYNFDEEKQITLVKQTNTCIEYGNEYLGNSPRLVITPLTDRCYVTLTLSLHLRLGGNPAGPAGTGKTETVKDMAKAVARQCVVFNCSDQIDYMMMGRFFSGLVQAGAWACFDEFNRIDIEVLSVIAQQLLTILDAIKQQVSNFEFEGSRIKLNPACGFFITMNPGYAGRTELPDNLKALFRPVAMMIPDYAMIAEIMLYSEGFQTAKTLAQKMAQLYKLSSEQLSQQDHYDFGMRAVKSVLVMAGAMKRKYSDLSEDTVLIRALRDTNTPKFLSDDVPLFMNIIRDLFPGVNIPAVEHASLQTALSSALTIQGLQPNNSFILKCLQLFETMEVRHGMMLVGQTGVGKTTCLRALTNALTDLHEDYYIRQNGEPGFAMIRTTTMNPKAVTMGELYGEFNEITREWHDGLVPFIAKEMIERSKDSLNAHASWQTNRQEGETEPPPTTREMMVFDGPVDAIWIESMNSVLDDNKILCLSNGDRIKFSPNMCMLFEVADLKVASPATVSRCGMVYLEKEQLSWKEVAESWKQRFVRSFPHLAEFADSALTFLLSPVVDFIRRKENVEAGLFTEFIPSTITGLVGSLLNLFTSLAVQFAQNRPSKLAELAKEAEMAELIGKGGRKGRKKNTKEEDEAAHEEPKDKDPHSSIPSPPSPLPTIPTSHTNYPPFPGMNLAESFFYEDQYPFTLASKHFLFSLVWTIGASLDDASKPNFDVYLQSLITLGGRTHQSTESLESLRKTEDAQTPGTIANSSSRVLHNLHTSRAADQFLHLETFTKLLLSISFPRNSSVYDVVVNELTTGWEKWVNRVPQFKFNVHQPFEEIVVQTADTVATSTLINMLVKANTNILVTGTTGTGKTVVVNDFLRTPNMAETSLNFQMNFSAQTSSNGVQEALESQLTHRRSNLIGPPVGKIGVVFIDDLNTPTPEIYFAQPPVELIRQCIDQQGIYDRKKLGFIHLADTTFIGACGPPGGGRHAITERLTRRFHAIGMPKVGETAMASIFEAITGGFFNNQTPMLKDEVIELVNPIVNSTVSLYQKACTTFLPTPSKSHYTFNLRDASNLISGVLHASPQCYNDPSTIVRLWAHESNRVFRDRLVDLNDRKSFDVLLQSMIRTYYTNADPPLSTEIQIDEPNKIVFADFPEKPGQDKVYREHLLDEKLRSILTGHLEDYNMSSPKQMNLVLFDDAILHLVRISRIIRMPRGNALVVGLGGSGRQSLIKLASHISGCKFFTVEVTKNYGQQEFRNDLKKALRNAGEKQTPSVLYISDNQIVKESFLEDVNNLLNTGEIPNIWESDELEEIVEHLRDSTRDSGKGQGRDDIVRHFVSLIRSNLHVVLCMSPSSKEFRSRLRQFPSLVNCCTMDWYDQWPAHALLQVAKRNTHSWSVEDKYMDPLAIACVFLHESVEAASKKFFDECKRHNYTTPTSYLELLGGYEVILREMDESIANRHSKLSEGLKTLEQTNRDVAELQQQLIAIQPQLEQSQKDTAVLMEELSVQQKEVEAKKEVVMGEEAVVSKATEESEALAEDAMNDLNRALPKYNAAIKAVQQLDKSDISEVKSFARPPDLVMFVMQAVCLLFGQPQTWEAAKKMMNTEFLGKLADYDKDSLDDKLKAKLKKTYISSPNFQPEVVESVSKAAKSLCTWVRALYDYSEVAKEVAPKREKVRVSQEKLAEMQAKLAEKKAELREVEEKMETLERKYNASVRKKEEIERDIENTRVKLERAEKLTSGLADEYTRWTETVKQLEESRSTLLGDALIACGYITYIGPFTAEFRQMLCEQWRDKLAALGIPVMIDGTFELDKALGDPIQIRQWNMCGLPSDSLSVCNAIIATRSRRWCLMIDPQNQANKWIKNLWKDRNIKMVKPHDPTLMRTMENSVRVGVPVLLENAGETFDPALNPILSKSVTKVGARQTIRIGDQDVDYSEDFMLFITTTLPNPHYTPEISIATTIIDFTVTPTGLAEQLLAETVKIERADLEEERDRLIVQKAKDDDEMMKVEDDILALLSSVVGSILDNETVIVALDKSRAISSEIKERAKQTAETTALINTARDEYRAVSKRGSLLYFVIASLSLADPMYQFSLSFFSSLFTRCIRDCKASKPQLPEGVQPSAKDTQEYVKNVVSTLTKTVWANVCRGLFERDKQVFSFLIAAQVGKEEGSLSAEEWRIFLLGSSSVIETKEETQEEGQDEQQQQPELPGPQFLKPEQQKLLASLEDIQTTVIVPVSRLQGTRPSSSDSNSGLRPRPSSVASLNRLEARTFTPYAGLLSHMTENEEEWAEWVKCDSPETQPLPAPWNNSFNIFQKMLILRVLREEKVVFMMRNVIHDTLGPEFSSPPAFDMKQTFAASDHRTPVVFILSAGTDPVSLLRNFSAESGNEGKLMVQSLGQGQGPIAEKLIDKGTKEGLWICLQNCHLCTSWMPALDAIVEGFSSPSAKIHHSFRLFLTSMPSKAFPVAALQASIKVTNEAPRGLKVNLNRSLATFEPHFDSAGPPAGQDAQVWHRLLYGLGLFHAVIEERRKFGALGWNVQYDWTQADLDVSRELLWEYTQQKGVATTEETGEEEVNGEEEEEGSVKGEEKTPKTPPQPLPRAEIPFAALSYIVCEISYGGRVTDLWDMRTLHALFKTFFTPEFLQPDFSLTPDGDYQMPDLECTYEQMQEAVKKLPPTDSPALFGLHPNAAITYQQRETKFVLDTLIKLQASAVSSRQKKKKDDEEEEEEEEEQEEKEEEREKEQEEGEEGDNENKDDQPTEDEDQQKEPLPTPQTSRKKSTGPVRPASLSESDEQILTMCQSFKHRIPINITFDTANESVLLQSELQERLQRAAEKTAATPGSTNMEMFIGGVSPMMSSPMTASSSQFNSPAKQTDNSGFSDKSLNVVLHQEAERFNKLLVRIHSSLSDLESAVCGVVVMSSELELMSQAFLVNQVPEIWSNVAYPSLKPLSSWVSDLLNRISFIKDWIEHGEPPSFLLPGFFFPQGFLTGVLQTHARLTQIAIDTLSFNAHVMDSGFGDENEENEQSNQPSSQLPRSAPETGVYIHGLFIEGARWDSEEHTITESIPGVLFSQVPVLWLQPVSSQEEKKASQIEDQPTQSSQTDLASSPGGKQAPKHSYSCPIYKTEARHGVLSTTGHSTNFIFSLDIPSVLQPEHWIRRGVAMLCGLSD